MDVYGICQHLIYLMILFAEKCFKIFLLSQNQ